MSGHQPGVKVRWGLRLPMRDGVELSGTLYLPGVQGTPTPTILLLTPYGAQEGHERGLYFARRGYAFLAIDCRGRGNSDGVFQPFIQEANDAFDAVEWTASQPHCDGRVAMCGGSYCGYAQWAAAKEAPPHLATIVPTASSFLAVDVWMRNNVCYPYLVRWLTLVWGRTSQEKIFWGEERFWTEKFREFFESGAPFSELDSMLGNPSPTFQEWIMYPTQGRYWDRFNPTSEQYSQISIPILTITGIYDSDQPGALTHYREHLRNVSEAARARHYLVIGPWHHGGMRKPEQTFAGLTLGKASLVDLYKLHLEWYDWTLRGGPKPEFLEDKVTYYVTGAEIWRHADSLETVTAFTSSLHLGSARGRTDIFFSGTLHPATPTGGPDTYVYDPSDLTIAEVESTLDHPVCLRPTFPTEDLTDQRALNAMAGKVLVYHSEPFEADTEISGFFNFTAWIAIDRPDTDFQVSIYEIDRDGNSLMLTADLMRARYRESLRTEQLIQTRSPLPYVFERFTFVSRLLRKGSRLRLVLGPINSIHYQRNYNSGGVVAQESIRDARTVTVKLFHSEEYPSTLQVPLGRLSTLGNPGSP